MKSGASDPFADDPGEDEDKDEGESTENMPSSEPSVSEPTAESVESDSSNSITREFDRSDLPYTLRRDKVKDERDHVHQLFVQDDTDSEERDARRDLEDRFDEDVFKLDAREAIYLAGLRNLDDAESILRKWGYDL